MGSVSVLFLVTVFVVGPKLGSELIPEVHQGEFNVEVTMPVGTPVERTDERIAEIQNFLMHQPGVKKVASVSGTDKTANSGSEEGEHTSKITVTLYRPGDRVRVDRPAIPSGAGLPDQQFASLAGNVNAVDPNDRRVDKKPAVPERYEPAEVVEEAEVVQSIREQMQNYSGVQWKISRPVLFSFKTPIEVEIHGYNLQKLQEISKELEERMHEISGVIDIKSNIQRGTSFAQDRPNPELPRDVQDGVEVETGGPGRYRVDFGAASRQLLDHRRRGALAHEQMERRRLDVIKE